MTANMKRHILGRRVAHGHSSRFGKMRLDITQHQLLLCYCAVVIKATEFCSAKNFILNFKIKNQQQFPLRGSQNISTSPDREHWWQLQTDYADFTFK